MKRRLPIVVLIAVLGALLVGLVVLFRLRLSQGDVFPAYSSLRADPLGIRVLHDSLALLPGLVVEQRFKPLARLEPDPPRTIVLAGVAADSFRQCALEDFAAVDAAVRAGSRVVVAFHAENARREKSSRAAERPAEQREPYDRPPRDRPGDPDYEEPENSEARKKFRRKMQRVDLQQKWDVTVVSDERIMQPEARAIQTARGDLPEAVGWGSDLYFRPKEGAEWKIIYELSGRPVLIERAHGEGSIVLAGDSFFLSNEALHKEPPTTLLAWIVGSHGRVVFDESHLGVIEDTGIAALARRYGLASAFFTLLLLAALWVWRRMALFVPPPPDTAEVALTYHPAAGLEALLRRAVPAGELGAACAAEWKRTARAGDIARVESAIAAAPKKSSAATLHNLALRALRRR